MRRKNERKANRGLLLVLAISALIVTTAQAELITIAIEAEVNEVSDLAGHLEGKISSGSLITGQYIYESTTMDSDSSSDGGEYLWNASPFGIFLMGGGFNFQTDPCNVNFSIGILNNSLSRDSYVVGSHENIYLSNGTTVNEIFWQLEDSTMTALDSDLLLLTAPGLGDWDYNQLYINGGPRESDFTIHATVTSAEVVPEPATVLFLLFGTALFRKRTL